ncbi:hypothetical protein F441_04759 [Phytophthora nicotianae CJ01A1]|uniref:Secreted protein n=1 Tax=Phytophthora nicotianae CJ01A1 TaxID=1317063 RepID=W2XGP6_PHYNI|nr:hypothetical protein F441_04759 [Phytophthora nicotianae CJ01A1]
MGSDASILSALLAACHAFAEQVQVDFFRLASDRNSGMRLARLKRSYATSSIISRTNCFADCTVQPPMPSWTTRFVFVSIGSTSDESHLTQLTSPSKLKQRSTGRKLNQRTAPMK